MQAALRGAAARQSFTLLPAALGTRRSSLLPCPTIAALLILLLAMALNDNDEVPQGAPRDGPGDGAGPGHGDPAGAAAAGPAAVRAEPWLGVQRRQAAEQAFDEAMQPLRNLYRDTSVAMELHRDVDLARGEAIQELRMEVARLKGTVLSHEDRIRQLGQALRYAQNVANLLPAEDDAGDEAAGGAGADPERGAGAGAAGDRRTRRRTEP